MILYKYMSLATARTILQTNRIGFSRPSFFNDPFDTPVAEPVLTSNAIAAVFAKVGAGAKSYTWEQNTAILSLTRTATNALMWAHYADKHQGAVLEIDTLAAGFLDGSTNMIPANFGSVVYSRHRPIGQYNSNFATAVAVGTTHHFVMDHYEKWQRLFLTKPLEWAYEEEVRVVKCIHGLPADGGLVENADCKILNLSDGRPLHCFAVPAASIKAVYVGARADQGAIDTLVKAFPEREFRRARLDQDRFGIDFEPLH